MKETARGPATGKRREIVRGNVREKDIGSGTHGTDRGTESAIGRRRRRDTEILLARNETARDTETESVSVSVSVRERAQPRAGRGIAIESESRNAIEQRTRREIANAYALESANAKAMMSGAGRRVARNEGDLQV